MPSTQAQTVTIDGFVLFDADRASYGDEKPFRWVNGAPSMYGKAYQDACVARHPITFTLPVDFHPTAALVKALEREREAVQREFAAKVAEINARISKLLAITNEAA
jgi:hypothetical protein